MLKSRCELKKKASLLYTRAYILGLPYRVVWDDYLEDWEKKRVYIRGGCEMGKTFSVKDWKPEMLTSEPKIEIIDITKNVEFLVNQILKVNEAYERNKNVELKQTMNILNEALENAIKPNLIIK